MSSKSVKLGATLAIAAGLALPAVSPASAGSGIGAVFNLGKLNTVNATTRLVGAVSTAMLLLRNNGNGPALALTVNPGKPPMAISRGAAKVVNLDADKVDGRSANELSRAAGAVNETVTSNVPDTDLVTVTINAPKNGLVIVTANAIVRSQSTTCNPCFAHAELTDDAGTQKSPLMLVSIGDGTTKALRTALPLNFVFTAKAGANTFKLRAGKFPSGSLFDFANPSITALFVPFDGNGALPVVSPAGAGVSAARIAGLPKSVDGSVELPQ